MMDQDALARLAAGQTAKGTPVGRGADVGACFQLALLAAAQGNDQEAGDYLRRVITAMKTMVGAGGEDAGVGGHP